MQRVEMSIRNVVVISDTHGGCKLALCPEEITLDEGGIYKSSPFQKELMLEWEHFWTEWVPMVTKDEPFYVVHNGDAIDGVHHNATTPITHNKKDQRKIAYEVLKDVVQLPKCAGYYHIRGTEAHVGKSGEDEEELARQLGAIPNPSGNYARWDLWLRFKHGNRLLHFTHHIGTTSSMAYESTAVYKELVEAYNESGRWDNEPPDAVIRSHRHRQMEIKVANQKGYAFSIVTPGWQLKTPFTYRLASGRAGEPQVGGYLIRSGDEDSLFTRFLVSKLKRPAEELI